MNNGHINSIVDALVSVVPIVLILVVLFFMLRKAEKNTKLGNVNPVRSNVLGGLFWIILGVLNFVLEANRHTEHQTAAFQQIYGVFAVAVGSFFLGLGVSGYKNQTTVAAKVSRKS